MKGRTGCSPSVGPCMQMLRRFVPVAKELWLPLAAELADPIQKLHGMWPSPSRSPCGLVRQSIFHPHPNVCADRLVKCTQPGILFQMFEMTPFLRGQPAC